VVLDDTGHGGGGMTVAINAATDRFARIRASNRRRRYPTTSRTTTRDQSRAPNTKASNDDASQPRFNKFRSSVDQAVAPAMARHESAHVRHISANFIICASSEAAHISAHIMHIRVHS